MTREEIKAILKEEGNYKAFEYKGYKCRILRIGEGMPFKYRQERLECLIRQKKLLLKFL